MTDIVNKSVTELQKDLDKWLFEYNNELVHSGKYCFGKTPVQTFQDSKHLAKEKMLDELGQKRWRKNGPVVRSSSVYYTDLGFEAFRINARIELFNG